MRYEEKYNEKKNTTVTGSLPFLFSVSFFWWPLAFQVSLSRPQALESDWAHILALLLPSRVTSKMYETFCTSVFSLILKTRIFLVYTLHGVVARIMWGCLLKEFSETHGIEGMLRKHQ